jgi:putative Mg2+ transporter-C (MgtC) family protein
MLERLTEGQVFLRLLLTVLAGVGLGLPYRRRPGGVRTHVRVTLGAALFCAPDAVLRRRAPLRDRSLDKAL